MKRNSEKKTKKYEICFYLDGVPTSKALSDDVADFNPAIEFFQTYLKERFTFKIKRTVATT